MPGIFPGQRWRNRVNPNLVVSIASIPAVPSARPERCVRLYDIANGSLLAPVTIAELRELYTLEDPNADT